MSEDLPEDYPHENAIYVYGGLVELVGANSFTFTPDAGHSAGKEITSHVIFWCWFENPDEPDKPAPAGINEDEITTFRADGGVKSIYKALLNLPERRVEDRDGLK